jgi:GTP-binding protein
MKEWEEALREKLGVLNFIPVVFTSVLEKKRLYRLLDEATAVFQELSRHISTHELNDYLLPIIKETSPPSAQGKEIKINYITQVRSNPPVICFFSNFPRLIAENYRRFLERKIRQNWNFRGVPVTVVFKAKHK